MPSRDTSKICIEEILDRVTALSLEIHHSSNLKDLLNVTVQKTRQILDCDRVIIYQFLPDGDGVTIAESVDADWTAILGQLIRDPCFHQKWAGLYQAGRFSVIEDTDAKSIKPCYANFLARMQVKASLVVPISIGQQPSTHLFGLLVAHQCDRPRHWQPHEISLLQNITTQVSIALRHTSNFQLSSADRSIEISLFPTLQSSHPRTYQRIEREILWEEVLLQSMSEASPFAIFVVDNRTDNILYFNHRFCEIWGIEHLEERMLRGELQNNDIIPDCIPLIADLPAFIESCKPLQDEENREVIEDEINFTDKRIVRRLSRQIRDRQDRYFGRLYVFEDITERKQIEHTVKAIEERRKYAIEASGDGVWDWNLITNEVYFSPQWKTILGFEDSEISNNFSEWESRIHPEDRALAYTEIDKHLRGEIKQYLIEHRLRCKDGSYKWILARGQIFSRTTDGSPSRFIGTHVDINDFKNVESALKDSEARQRAILTAMPDLLLRVNHDGLCLDFMLPSGNEANQFMTIGQHLSEVLPPDLLKNQLQAIARAIATNQLQVYSHQISKFDKLAYEEVRISAINNREALVIIRDITDRVESEQRLEQISLNIPGVIYQYRLRPDGSSHFPYASQGIRDIYDVSPKDVYQDASAVFERLHPEDLEHVGQTIADSAQNLTVWQCEYRVRFADGRIIWVYGTAIPQRETDGSTLWHGYITEITDRKQAEFALQQSEATNRALIQAIPDFLVWMRQDGMQIEVINDESIHCLSPTSNSSNNVTEIMPFEIAQERIQLAQLAIETGQIQKQEYKFVDRDKTYYEEARIVPLWKNEVLVVVRDISDRKRAEAALQVLNRDLEQRVKERTEALKQQAEQERLLRFVTQRIHTSLNYEEIIYTVLTETRQTIYVDRVAIYRFDDDWSGRFVAESVSEGWMPLVGPDIQTVWEDTYLQETQGGRYRNNETFAVSDIYTIGHTQCHVEILEQFQVKAYAIVPIFVRGNLWGLLAAYQNSGPRQWQNREIILLQQIALSTAIAIQQSDLFQQVQTNLAVKGLLVEVAETINESLDLDEVLETCLNLIQEFLNCDRAIVCQLHDNGNGTIFKEALARPELSILGQTISDPYFSEAYLEGHKQGGIIILNDLETDDISPCYAEFLAELQVRASLAVPIFRAEKLWGLLLVNQIDSPRQWQPFEIEMLKWVALELGIASQKMDLYTRLENELRQKELLIKEVHHRVKNNLQVVSSLLNLQSSSIEDPNILEPFLESQRRINVMAVVHERLYRSGNLVSLNFAQYIEDLVEDVFQSHLPLNLNVQWQVEVANLDLELDIAIPCGLIVNELVSNAIKYAFPHRHAGKIDIIFTYENSLHWLAIGDNGIGFPKTLDFRNTESLGMQIVCALTRQLGGTIALNCEGGTTFVITF